MIEEPPNTFEKEQSREQIEALLKEALEKKLVVDLVIEDRMTNQPNMTVDDIDEEVVSLSSLEDKKGGGYCVPLRIDLVRKVTLKGPLSPNGSNK